MRKGGKLEDWKVERLGDVIQLEYGKPLPASKRNENGKYPVYGANGEKGRSDEYYYDKPTIIVGRKGSAGEINLTEKRFWPLDVTYFVTFDDKEYDLQFLYYLLGKLELTKLAKGVKPGINRNEVYSIEVSIPPLPEQQRIVSVLDEAFESIAQAKSNAERNLVNARELFETVFQSLFENGENWKARKLEDVCEISSKLVDPRLNQYLDLPHVGGANIVSKQGNLVELQTARAEGLKSGKFLFDEKIVLYSKIRPYLMKVARPDFKGLCSADIYPLLPVPNEIIRDYLFYLLLTPDFTKYAIKGSARAGMPKVNRDHLFEYIFSLPPLAEQRAIVGRLEALSAETKPVGGDLSVQGGGAGGVEEERVGESV